jgi:hypothetical protein
MPAKGPARRTAGTNMQRERVGTRPSRTAPPGQPGGVKAAVYRARRDQG